MSVAAALELEDGTIKEARLALGGVAHKPWRDQGAEAALRGKTAGRDAFSQAADSPAARRQGLYAQRVQDRSGAPRHNPRLDASRVRHAANSIQQEDPVNVMAPYIGTPTSRVDGHAKVTGAAKYAGEFNTDGLVYAAVVGSTIAKGRIARIDTGEALRVAGVLDVLTHDNRPRMAKAASAYKDDVAPEGGSPFRPLYDDKILFSGQPIALVLAEEWEIARFAATLVRVEYRKEASATDLEAQRNKAFTVKTPEKPRGNADKAFAAAAVRHEAEYFIPIEHHNPMELYASTAIWEGGGKLTVYDKTQGVQNVQRYLCGAFEMKTGRRAGHVALHGRRLRIRASPELSGGARGPRGARARALGAAGSDPAADVQPRLPAGDDRTRRARRERNTESSTLSFTRPSPSRRNTRIFSGTTPAGRASSIKVRMPKYVHKLVRLDLATPCDMRAPGAATGVHGLECAMDELAVALNVDPVELRLRYYSDRDQHEDIPYTSKKLRECYRQGAEAFGWGKRNAEPRSMRDGSELVGWGMATGIWEALQMEFAARIVLTANGHAEVACATSDIGTGTYTIMAQLAADMLGLPLDNITVKLGDFDPAAGAGRGRLMDRSLGVACHRQDRRPGAQGIVAARQKDTEFAARERQARRHRAQRRQDRELEGSAAPCRSPMPCVRAVSIASNAKPAPTSKNRSHMPKIRTRRFSPR